MATNISLLEEHLSCPICCDIFNNPVVLQCSHSFCHGCLQQCWQDTESVTCPVCRKECSTDEPRVSLALKGLCESIQSNSETTTGSQDVSGSQDLSGSQDVSGSQDMCLLHDEKLKLFCFKDKQPICVVCHTSKAHKGHECYPIEEAVSELQDEIKVIMLKSKCLLEPAKVEHKTLMDHITYQGQCGEDMIRAQFVKLHQFLEEEEAARIAALKKEEKQKYEVIREINDTLIKGKSSFLETASGINKDMKNNVTFLKNYKSILDRAKSTSQGTPQQTDQGMLINMAQHIGSLKFKVWNTMRALLEHNPVTMDPNTLCNKLILNDDLNSVTYSEETQAWPEVPERMCAGVLGSEGYNKGNHYWVVEVGDSDNWTLGVVNESITRKRMSKMVPESGLWSIRFVSGKYRAGVKARSEIHVAERPRVIRVQLNYNKGELKFSNQITQTELYTFNNKFTGIVYPYFNTSSLKCPLKLQILDLNFKGVQ